jgi:TRAP-type uncharacterized transport system fused permease subunit
MYLLMVKQYSPELSAFWSIQVLVITYLGHEVIRRDGRRVGEVLRDGVRALLQGMVNGGRGMMTIGVAVAAAGIIVGVVSLGPGQRITEVVAYLAGDNILLILFVTAVASLILGMGLPTTANYIVMASLTAPVIIKLAGDAGYDMPPLAVHLFCFYFGILADDTPPVGLAAYAGAAIAKSDPIRTGLQAFFYDMRTAILPFMFIFNTDLLLYGLTAPWQIVGVFVMGAAAMMSFAAATQRHFFTKLRYYEVAAFLLTTLLFLRPRILGDVAGWAWVQRLLALAPEPAGDSVWRHPALGYALGWAVLGAVVLSQVTRRRMAAESARAID